MPAFLANIPTCSSANVYKMNSYSCKKKANLQEEIKTRWQKTEHCLEASKAIDCKNCMNVAKFAICKKWWMFAKKMTTINIIQERAIWCWGKINAFRLPAKRKWREHSKKNAKCKKGIMKRREKYREIIIFHEILEILSLVFGIKLPVLMIYSPVTKSAKGFIALFEIFISLNKKTVIISNCAWILNSFSSIYRSFDRIHCWWCCTRIK